MSDFAEYVERQQSLRYPTARPPTFSTASHSTAPPETTDTSCTTETTDATKATDLHHTELDELFDNLDLGDALPRTPLKELLLSSDERRLHELEVLIAQRLQEGFGEAVFEVGYDNNGESMQLSPEDWAMAYDQLVEAAKLSRANCDLLLTKNVGGDKEASSTAKVPSKDKSCSGKVLIRQFPTRIEDVIETRIAVVGNGTHHERLHPGQR